jgi:hypothetical protein
MNNIFCDTCNHQLNSLKKILLFGVMMTFMIIQVKAQASDPEMDYIKKTYSKDKRTIVDEYMSLNVQDGGKFWPVYADYEANREKLATARINLINQYVSGYDSLTPEITDKLIKASFENTISLDKLNADYYDKMKKAVGAVNAAKYMQLEIYLQTMWKAVVQSNIPLIGQLNNTKQN